MRERRLVFEAIGTKWTIAVRADMAGAAWHELTGRLRTRIELFDATWSRFRADSLVTQMSRQAGTYTLPADGYALLRFYERLYRATDGAVTPLIGQVMSDAGYDASYSLRAGRLHKPPRWENVIRYDEATITLVVPALLDFGAAGKGYLVDIVGDMLRAADIGTFWINAGGDILQQGSEPLSVGLENPLAAGEAVGVARLHNRSLCASSGARRVWAGYHHIINPKTLQSPDHIAGTWVMAGTAMAADGLATALFFADPHELKRQFTFDYAVLDRDMSLRRSHGFPAEVFEAAA